MIRAKTDNQKKEVKQVALLKAEIASLKQTNSELRKSARKADSASKAKSDFLAMISHEIRTPMNGVIGLSKLLLDADLGERQRHFAELINTSASSLLTLINSLLDYSKIEAEKMVLDVEPFDIYNLVEELVKIYSVTANQKGLAVRLKMDQKLSRYYLGDEYRIRQILVNLIGNSIKFTEKGEITIEIEKKEQKEDTDLIRFLVKDTGIGVAPQMAKKLFQPFSQADDSSTRRFGGTGLGLSICAKLVELMNGKIGLESEVGIGSTFSFSLYLQPRGIEGKQVILQKTITQLPLPLVQNNNVEKQDQDDGNVKILIVDDDRTNRIVLEELFRSTGATLYSAENGKEALDQCQNINFDLIFMDCQMPVMDGFEATKQIYSVYKRQFISIPPIIALTADATSQTKEMCYEVGMSDYLIKPLDFEILQSTLDTWLEPDKRLQVVSTDNAKKYAINDKQGDKRKLSVINNETFERLKEHVGNIEHIVSVFLNSIQNRYGELQQAVNEKDADQVKKIAHMLKGSSSQIGATELARLCATVEQAGTQNNMSQIIKILPHIGQAVLDVKDFFKNQLD